MLILEYIEDAVNGMYDDIEDYYKSHLLHGIGCAIGKY